MVWIAVGEREPACDGAGARRVDAGHAGEAGDGVEADHPAARCPSAVHAELRDHAGHVEDHPVERAGESRSVGGCLRG
ncbi:hypothetical protein [Saccharomonospora xinjiangensis]|uniref:hypothetical protein n=1 Tax=Saccharomonospora xinjiangensis TaxID=75294 RepID=UPI0014307AFC|nr:hypothetical protein [Saccharomonospora xinjiangensis]